MTTCRSARRTSWQRRYEIDRSLRGRSQEDCESSRETRSCSSSNASVESVGVSLHHSFHVNGHEATHSTAGEIAVKYGCVEAEEEKQLGRQLSVPVALTVHRALEATTMSISRRNHVRPAHREANDERGLERIEADAHALLAVDVRNVYGQPFEVRIESQSEEGASSRAACAGRSLR